MPRIQYSFSTRHASMVLPVESVRVLISLRVTHPQEAQTGAVAGVELDPLPGEPRGSRYIAGAVVALRLPEQLFGVACIHGAKRLGLALFQHPAPLFLFLCVRHV